MRKRVLKLRRVFAFCALAASALAIGTPAAVEAQQGPRKAGSGFCNDSFARGVAKKYSDRPNVGVRLASSREVFHPGETAYAKVENLGKSAVSFGRPFRVERYDGRWTRDPASPTGPWPSDRIVVRSGRAGGCMGFEIPGDFRAGRYRFGKFVGLATPEGGKRLFVTSQIKVVSR
jgi:hypothetical protein